MRPIVAEVEGGVNADLATSFHSFAPIDLTKILRGYGPLPAVAAVVDQRGGWDEAGQSRTVRLADGSQMREELTLVEAPHHFAYRIDGFTGPFRHLVREMRGGWWFDALPVNAGEAPRSRARWRYEFECTAGWSHLASLPIVRFLWTPYMARALAAATAITAAASATRREDSRC